MSPPNSRLHRQGIHPLNLTPDVQGYNALLLLQVNGVYQRDILDKLLTWFNFCAKYYLLIFAHVPIQKCSLDKLQTPSWRLATPLARCCQAQSPRIASSPLPTFRPSGVPNNVRLLPPARSEPPLQFGDG